MKLYDFSAYASLRKEITAAKAVVEVVHDMNKSGSAVELKTKVVEWFKLHKEVEKLRA